MQKAPPNGQRQYRSLAANQQNVEPDTFLPRSFLKREKSQKGLEPHYRRDIWACLPLCKVSSSW